MTPVVKPQISEPPVLELTGLEVIIWDYQLGSFIYSSLGFFGKALGERKIDQGLINRPFILSIFESIYLFSNNIIRIKKEDRLLTMEDLFKIAKKEYVNFRYKYHIYKDLRDLGYVVRPGMKFGYDFIVYTTGPGIDHSEYVVHVENSRTEIKAINVVRAGRLATSVRKKYLIAIPDSEDSISYLKLERVKI